MRAVLAASMPVFLVVGAAFFACGGIDQNGASDAGPDAKDGSSTMEVGFGDVPTQFDAGFHCAIAAMGSLKPTYDPVAYCALRDVLGNQHDIGFDAKSGTAARWNYQFLLVDDGGGLPVHDVRNDAAYGSSLADFFQWSQLYVDDSATLDSDGGTASGDMIALASILAKDLAKLPNDYDGELYFNLRNFSVGLKYVGDNADSAAIEKLAFAYGRQIYDSFYFDLPLAGTDAGASDAGGNDGGAAEAGTDAGPTDAAAGETGPVDAAGGPDTGVDRGATGDGILGVNQQPSTGTPGILYQPDKVASAAYALLDLANSNAFDPDASKWITAARRALDHIYDKARDPASGLHHASLVTTGSRNDVLGNLTSPASLLSSDVQATVILYLIRAGELVAASTQPLDAGLGNPDVFIPLDASLSGVLAPMGHFPFLPRADAVIGDMDALWDGAGEGGTGRLGYLDGLVPETLERVQTKSTRPNAYMFAALHLRLEKATAAKLNDLRILLVNELPLMLPNPGLSTGLFTVVSGQQGYFDTVTSAFKLLNASVDPSGPDYTAAAAAAVVAGFNEQLVGFRH